MSYSQQSGRGPRQSPEDSRTPPPPSLEHSTSSSFSLIDIDSPKVKQDTAQAADTASQKASSAADSTKENAGKAADQAQNKGSENAQYLKEKANEAAEYTKQKASEGSEKTQEGYEKAKKEAKRDGKIVKEKTEEGYNEVYENRDNPVVIANGVVIVVGAVALAYGGYQKYKVGELDWQVGGAAAAVVGILGVGDYYLSQWLFQNKYPKK